MKMGFLGRFAKKKCHFQKGDAQKKKLIEYKKKFDY